MPYVRHSSADRGKLWPKSLMYGKVRLKGLTHLYATVTMMTHPQTIQEAVAQALAEKGLPAPTCWIRKPFFEGHRFLVHEMLFAGGRAVWIAERNVVEVYDDQGTLLKAVTLASAAGRRVA